MARIRSVHPSIWTDEDFVELSFAARLFFIGLFNEADDYGIFPWKPKGLKMRLAPADDVDVPAVLGEIVAAGFARRVTHDDQPYGVLRSFRRWQRPQRASAPAFPVTDEHLAYIQVKDSEVDKIPPEHRGLSVPATCDHAGTFREGAGNDPAQMTLGSVPDGDDVPPNSMSPPIHVYEPSHTPHGIAGQMERRGEERRGESGSVNRRAGAREAGAPPTIPPPAGQGAHASGLERAGGEDDPPKDPLAWGEVLTDRHEGSESPQGARGSSPHRPNGLGEGPERVSEGAPAEVSGDSAAVAAAFLRDRDELWPEHPALPAPILTIRTQAAQYLALPGVTAAVLSALVRAEMDRFHQQNRGPPTGLNAFTQSLPRSIAAHQKASQPVEIPSHDLARSSPIAASGGAARSESARFPKGGSPRQAAHFRALSAAVGDARKRQCAE